MNRIMIAGALAAAACAISIPAASAMTTDGPSGGTSGPSHSQLVDDRSGPNRGGDDIATATPTSITMEPGDDNGTHAEPGDDNGGHSGRR